jgi:hypothetical protein
MNEWEIKYVYNGNRTVYIMADTLEMALKQFRDTTPNVPAIALESIKCVR